MTTIDYDAIIIGAGVSGMYQLHTLRELGLSVRVLEAGTGVGGTWYWNRYPGARFDSESYSYGYSFNQEILDEWDWSEHFAAQPEILRYLEFVADKLDLRRDIQFNTRVDAAAWQAGEDCWSVTCADGSELRARFLITAIGPLSATQMPNIPGIDDFAGPWCHTSKWPHEGIDLAGKRVAVIGTGATGVQVIQTIASEVGHLTVFQRHPNYCAPLGNRPIDAAEMAQIRARYSEIFQACRESFGSFIHRMDRRSAFDLSDQEREAFFEELYASPGFRIWLGNFADTLTDQKANDTITAFMRRKIRERIDDPAIAEKLVPQDHGFGLRRVPMETGYYEVFNRDNVLLVDCLAAPIEQITPTGIKTSDAEYPFDVIIYATGFYAVMGGFERIAIEGLDGRRLQDKWADGPRTYLGLQTAGFPNLFTLVGPHNGASFCNIPRCIEQNVEWVTDAIAYLRAHDYRSMTASVEAEDEWTRHVYETASRTLFPNVDSWFTNINRNRPENKRTFLLYTGGSPVYRDKCDAVAANDYEGFVLT